MCAPASQCGRVRIVIRTYLHSSTLKSIHDHFNTQAPHQHLTIGFSGTIIYEFLSPSMASPSFAQRNQNGGNAMAKPALQTPEQCACTYIVKSKRERHAPPNIAWDMDDVVVCGGRTHPSLICAYPELRLAFLGQGCHAHVCQVVLLRGDRT